MRFAVQESEAGRRLDQFLHARLPQYSRARLQEWIRQGRVKVGGQLRKSSYAVRPGEHIDVEPAELPPLRALPEAIPVHVLYADDAVIAVDKPAGMAVHLGAGRHSGTLVNALLHHFQSLSTVSGQDRPGIVHRLDKDTSGVLLVARTDQAHQALAAQFAARKVEKTYLALVQGVMQQNAGVIQSPIARDPVRRTRMTARLGIGRPAWTEYRVLQRLPAHTYLEVIIKTGRTHQIRAHLSSIGFPIAGDRLYGAAPGPLKRFFLHAWRIRFQSSATGQLLTVESPLPPELRRWLDDLYNKK